MITAGCNKHTRRIQLFLLLIASSVVAAEQTMPPKHVPRPDLGQLNLDCDVSTVQDRTALICFWDYSQRPSRRFVKELAALRDQLGQLNVPVLLIQTDPQNRAAAKAWLAQYQIGWPCGTLTAEIDAHRRLWSVSALPWPMLTDAHQIQSMGFSLEQLRAALASKDLGSLPLHTSWRYTFENLYSLQDGEILKRIPPPFDPARKKYYENKRPGRNDLPDRLVFHWDGGLQHWGEAWGDKGSLGSTLSFVIGLKRYEYDIPDDRLDTALHGDWIIRNKLPAAQKLAALAPIASKALQRPISFALRKVEREAVVVTGTFELNPLDGKARRREVYLYTDPNDDRSSGGGGMVDSVLELVRVIGDRIEMPVVDNTAKRSGLDLGYSTLRSSYLQRVKDPVARRQQVQILLDNVSKQTGLSFEFKQQQVHIWFLVDKQHRPGDASEKG